MTELRTPAPLAFLTVVRNDLGGLRATWASLRAQSWRGFEWIVVDGASTDGTAEWLAAHAGEATWWRSAPDRGVYDAMNAALDAATADAVLFLNAGDTLAEPRTAARLAEALAQAQEEGPPADLLYGDALERTPEGEVVLKRARSHRLAGCGMFTHHQAIVYRRAAVCGLRFQERFPVGADYAFTLQALAGARRVVRLSFPVCVFGPAGLSARHAGQGRRDQARARREMLGYGAIPVAVLALLQGAAQALRDCCPTVYRAVRFRKPERTFLSAATAIDIATKC